MFSKIRLKKVLKNFFVGSSEESNLPIFHCGTGDLPDNIMTESEMRKRGKTPTGRPVAILRFASFHYYLYDINKSRDLDEPAYQYYYEEYKEQEDDKENSFGDETIHDINDETENKVTYLNWKDVPSNLKTKSALAKEGLVPSGEHAAEIHVYGNAYKLFDKNTAIPYNEKENRFSEDNISLSQINEPEDKNELILPFYSDWKEIPSFLKTKTSLSKENLFPVGPAISEIRINGNTYPLFDKRTATNQKPVIEEPLAISPEEYLGTKVNEIPITNVIDFKNPKSKFLSDEEKSLIQDKINKEEDSFDIVPWMIQKNKWISNKSDYVIVDIETTGFGKDDEIIQLAIIDLYGKIIYHNYFYPKASIKAQAVKLHGLDLQFLANQSTWEKEWDVISLLLKNKTLIGFNQSFIKRILIQTCISHNIEIGFDINIDCLMHYSKEKFTLSSFEKVLAFIGIEDQMINKHNALIDCFSCLSIIEQDEQIFKLQKQAKEIFMQSIEIKKRKGFADAKERALLWLKSEFGINDRLLWFNCFDIDQCNIIIKKLTCK